MRVQVARPTFAKTLPSEVTRFARIRSFRRSEVWPLQLQKMVSRSRRGRRKIPSGGLTLVEVSISTLLVGLVLVASLRSVGHTIRSRSSTSDAARAQTVAEALLAEVLNEDYEEPLDTPVFGPEAGEVSGDRSLFDDVDDYHGWSSRPPTERLGSPLANLTDWQRDVVVEYVQPGDPTSRTGVDTGVKRVTVTVHLGGLTLAESVGLRSDKH